MHHHHHHDVSDDLRWTRSSTDSAARVPLATASDHPPTLNRTRYSKIWNGYIRGQLANVGRAAVWWSTFGILSIALLRSDLALAASRGAFNLALLLAAPMAVAAAEKVPIRPMLISTTFGRLIIWSAVIPIGWVLFTNALHWHAFIWAWLTAATFLDGVAVAFANSVDVDCGGLDLLAHAYKMPITNYLRYRYTTLHQTVFDLSFILFTPPCVAALVFLNYKIIALLLAYPTHSQVIDIIIGPDPSTFVLIIGVAAIFALLSLVSIYYYKTGIPAHQPRDVWTNRTGSACRRSSWAIYNEKLGEVIDGLILVLNNPALKWRLTSLAMETALEDAMVSVVIPMIAINATPILMNTNDITVSAIISVAIVAVGKLGGLLASAGLSNCCYLSTNLTEPCHGQRLFNLVLLSSSSLIFLPLGYYIMCLRLDFFNTVSAEVLGAALILMGAFFFFVFSTAPKIGFASLIQTAVSADEAEASETFGFIGIFVTITDGLLIILINLIFYHIGRDLFEVALLVVFGFYIVHGILEWKYGTRYIGNDELETTTP